MKKHLSLILALLGLTLATTSSVFANESAEGDAEESHIAGWTTNDLHVLLYTNPIGRIVVEAKNYVENGDWSIEDAQEYVYSLGSLIAESPSHFYAFFNSDSDSSESKQEL